MSRQNVVKAAKQEGTSPDKEGLIRKLGKERLLKILRSMLRIRNFEIRAESAYQQGFVGGFFHSYVGQEAVQTAAIDVMGEKNWWITSYRCHALALLLGVHPNEIMAELYGRSTGNALGRGGSMHLYSDRLLGGFGIVGGQVPIATGAAFTIKYKGIQDEVAVCFLGDGAVAQGAFHESLNLAALWKLPCIYVIENNQWGMGTKVDRALSVKRLAEEKAPGYGMNGYTFDGMDFFACFEGFQKVHEEVLKTSMPVLVEVLTERFKGHSVSDPALYRSKDELKACMAKDPIARFRADLEEAGLLTEALYKEIDQEEKEIVLHAMRFAEESPWPSPSVLEEGVFKE